MINRNFFPNNFLIYILSEEETDGGKEIVKEILEDVVTSAVRGKRYLARSLSFFLPF